MGPGRCDSMEDITITVIATISKKFPLFSQSIDIKQTQLMVQQFCIQLRTNDKLQLLYSDLGFPSSSDGKTSISNARDPGSISGSGISPAEGNGNILQYSCLENSMEREAWWAIIHGVTKESNMTERLTYTHCTLIYFFFFSFIFISWRLITSQHCSGCGHTLT